MGTYMTGPIETGTGLDNTGADTGKVILSQTRLITRAAATLVQDATFALPANAQIVDFYVDVLTAYNPTGTATLSAGLTSGGTEYLSGVSVKTAARRPNAFSAAQLAAMDDIGTNTALVATVTLADQPAAGQVRVTVLYVQN